ncbi:MAG: hypothetical protein RL707_1859 [Pseudomonadota bacterium]
MAGNNPRRDLMHDACPDWEVPKEAWEIIEPSLELPDANDRHVLAAAIAGHPDEFLLQQLELEPLVVLPAFKVMRSRLKNPAFTPEKFVDALERNGLIQTAAFLRQALQLI